MKRTASITLALLMLLSGCTLDNEVTLPSQTLPKDEVSSSDTVSAPQSTSGIAAETTIATLPEETVASTPAPETNETEAPAPETSEIIIPAPETNETEAPAPETSETQKSEPEVSETEAVETTPMPDRYFDPLFSNFFVYEDNLPQHIVSIHVREAYFDALNNFVLVVYVYNPFDTYAEVHKLDYLEVSDAKGKDFALTFPGYSFNCTIEPRAYVTQTLEFKAEEQEVLTYDIDFSKISLSYEISYMRE
ncbi:MAG: hypothetical protein IKT78_05245 [Ruminiclostridium sp.]|nr:hypothetical protein [Ruminiclostridium sp.]